MSNRDAFFEIHKSLPRQAPGSDERTQAMLDIVLHTGQPRVAVDIGCGPGRSTLILAHNGIRVTALDTHQPFLDELVLRAQAAGVSGLVEPVNTSMTELAYADGAFDLVWAEGSAYIVGWEQALQNWRQLVKPGGFMAASECCWLTDAPSAENADFWQRAYPTMLTRERAAATAERCGWRVLGIVDFTDGDWQEYYGPLAERHARLALDTREEMQAALAMSRKEIEIRTKYGHEYNYIGFVLQRTAE